MLKIRHIGLDVHKETITIAVADANSPAYVLARIANDAGELLKRLRKLGSDAELSVCYEAGPTGYGLCRELRAAKIECIVVAPSLVPVRSGERIKTDPRDARKLAHFLRSGDLTPVWVPDIQTEAMRDLVRAREAAKRAERVARQQLDKFLLRQGRIYAGKINGRARIGTGYKLRNSSFQPSNRSFRTQCTPSRKPARVWHA